MLHQRPIFPIPRNPYTPLWTLLFDAYTFFTDTTLFLRSVSQQKFHFCRLRASLLLRNGEGMGFFSYFCDVTVAMGSLKSR